MKLRPAIPADLALLRHWDTKPHVIAATGNDEPVDWAAELPRCRPDWQELLIAEAGGRPVGLIQIIDPAREESHYWGDVEENLRAIDIWIGEESDLGRGYGSEMMRLALERCFADEAVKAVLVDPLASNKRAHRFYERRGFRPVQRRVFGSDDCLVHRLERDAWRRTAQSGQTARGQTDIDALVDRLATLPRDGSGHIPLSRLMPIIRELRRDHRLALGLWEVATPATRHIAVRIADPARIDDGLLDGWVKDLDDWRITDAFAAYTVRPSVYARTKPFEWAMRKPLFERRAGFATIAQMAWVRNDVPDQVFAGFLPVIEAAATDERLHVKKAVNWALRAIGRRNAVLCGQAEATARRLRESNHATPRWVGRHRIGELYR